MEFILQRCCTTPIFLKYYETSTDIVLKDLGVGLIDEKDFNCCGYPLKNYDMKAYVLCSARNLSIAQKRGLNIMTFCNCCYGSLKEAKHIMKTNAGLNEQTNACLQQEGLFYNGDVEIRHLLGVFYRDLGLDGLRDRIKKRFKGLKIATHYGCHILRPKEIIQFDNPFSPSIFDELVELTGATSIQWSKKLDCCGSPVWGINDELSLDLLEKKIDSAIASGAHFFCVACSYCQLQFDRVQKILIQKRGLQRFMPSILYTQLLGLSMGIGPDDLGIGDAQLDISRIMDFLY